jgi:hypothetical protein
VVVVYVVKIVVAVVILDPTPELDIIITFIITLVIVFIVPITMVLMEDALVE